MPQLTKENAKYHCRTCLMNLSINSITVENQSHSKELNSRELHADEFKDFCINIKQNSQLHYLLLRYVDEKLSLDSVYDVPQNVCIGCYDKLQAFDTFCKGALESAETLKILFSGTRDAKNMQFEYMDNEQQDEKIISQDDIYKLLLKDTLMEPEAVLLDNNEVTALASVEVHDPDPFGTTENVVVNNLQTNESTRISLDGFDWKEHIEDTSNKTSDAIKFENNLKNSEISEDEAHADTHVVEDSITNSSTDSEEPCLPEHAIESAPSQNIRHRKCADKSIEKRGKKKRRTRKEMEEFRRAQKIDQKIQRRNKGTKNNFKCAQCNHSFAHKITLDAHVRKVHEGIKRPFQCDRCDKSYTFIGGLYTHIKEIHETEVRSYSCDYSGCDRIYTSFIAMQKHKRLKHSGTISLKKYVCEQCGATFTQTGNLKIHRRTKHPTEAEKEENEKSKEHFECKICNKTFHSRYTLKYHTLQLHSNDMKYECNICGRRMAKKFMLVQHMLVHSNDKTPCEHCGKQFIRKFELEAHIRAVHMKLKPFECQYCSECFASRKTLRHHEYIHTGEKPYVCDICGQAYRQQTCLKNHRKSHEKLTADSLLAANINRSLINNFLEPSQQTQLPLKVTPPCSNPMS